jgi:hypothetical protein
MLRLIWACPPAGKHVERVGIFVAAFLVFYFSAVAVASRSYWVGMFWSEYLDEIPRFDLIQGPQEFMAKYTLSTKQRIAYKNGIEYITAHSITPSTLKFCPFDEHKFGVLKPGFVGEGHPAMDVCVDMQNVYGAMIRRNFTVVFSEDKVSLVLQEDGSVF